MANWRGHTGGGIVAGLSVASAQYIYYWGGLPDGGRVLQDWELLVGILVISVLFALWPDVDTNSKAQNLYFGIAFIADIALILSGSFEAAAILGLLAMTPIVGKHRGWTHSKLSMVVVPLPILIVPYLANEQIGQTGVVIYAASVAGYFSHLLLDGLIYKKIRLKTRWN